MSRASVEQMKLPPRCCRQESVDAVWTGDRFGLGATVAFELGPDASERGQRSVVVEREPDQTTSFFLVSGFGSGAYSAKLLNGTKQRFSGFNQPRQCGDVALRMLVTGNHPNLGGGGMPHRIITSSRSPRSFRTTGAGHARAHNQYKNTFHAAPNSARA
jgi:hypothetical protein